MRPNGAIDVVIPVYNGAATIVDTLHQLLNLADCTQADMRLIVCDDGSTDATAMQLAEILDQRLTVVTLAQNSGRSAACNAAVRAADASYLLILDADCRPSGAGYADALGELIGRGIDLAYGPIQGDAEGFWKAYLAEVEARRNRRALQGHHLQSMTTGNLLLRRDLFESAGGFSELYRYYGFEDKDLIARLLSAGVKPVYENLLSVTHEAGNTVAGYCAKMKDAGRYSAPVFAATHPQQYRSLAFARLDPDLYPKPLRPLLRVIGRIGAPPLRALATWAAGSWLPGQLQIRLVKLAAAFSYLHGAGLRSTR